jgi:ABC-2 type transport system ATP-binding protein
MMPALEVRGLTRRFGALTAVDAISFQIHSGEICGFIGPNGAGKTTAMRICATLDLPDEGDVFVGGRSILEEPRRVRRRLGFMPDSYGAYSSTSVADYLDFFARAYKLRGRKRRETIDRLVEFTSLGDLLGKNTSDLSKGMKQRLCLARTLLNDPDLLILDEPAAGLDPRARIELRELVKALGAMNKAVLISSHILTELGEMCDSVVVIEEGRIRAAEALDAVTRRVRAERRAVYIRALCGAETLEKALLEEPLVISPRREREGVVIEFEGDESELARLVSSLVRRGLDPVEVTPERVGLEDVFLSLTEGRVQ